MSRSIVSEKHLIDYRTVFILHLKWSPSKVIAVDLNASNSTRSSLITRIYHLICRINHIMIVDPWVIVRIKNLLCEWIRHTDYLVWFTINSRVLTEVILETIFLIRIKACHGKPPTSVSVITIHAALIIICKGPIVEVTHDICIILMLAILILIVKNESNLTTRYIDTIIATTWNRLAHIRLRKERLIFIIRYSNESILLNTLEFRVLTTDNYTDLSDCGCTAIEIFAY